MRAEVGALIRQTYLVFSQKRMSSFSDAKLYIVAADHFNGTNKFFCFLGHLGRELMVWKNRSRRGKLAPQTPASRNFSKMISSKCPLSYCRILRALCFVQHTRASRLPTRFPLSLCLCSFSSGRGLPFLSSSYI